MIENVNWLSTGQTKRNHSGFLSLLEQRLHYYGISQSNEVKVVDVLLLFHFPDLKLCQVRKRDKRLTSCEVVFHFTKKVTDTNLTEARLIYNVNIDIMISGDPALE